MEKGIDVALWIGILLNFTKGADLLLTNAQKRWVDNKFKSFDKWLNNLNLLNVFQKLLSLKSILIFFTIIIFTELFLFKYYYALVADYVFLGNKLKDNIYLILVLQVFFVGISAQIIRKDLKRLLTDKKYIRHLLFSELFALTSVVLSYVVLTIIYIIYDWINNEEVSLGIAVEYFVQACVTFLFPYSILILAFLVSISLKYLVKILLFILISVSKRLLEHSKGVYSALILVITIILGFIKLYNG